MVCGYCRLGVMCGYRCPSAARACCRLSATCGCRRRLSAVCGCVISVRRFVFRYYDAIFICLLAIQTSKIYLIKDKKSNQVINMLQNWIISVTPPTRHSVSSEGVIFFFL